MSRKIFGLHEIDLKVLILKVGVAFIIVIIGIRLFYLQVLRYDFYEAIAAQAHYSSREIPARRGDIFIKDYASNEPITVATNITLYTLYADPKNIQNTQLVADRLGPIIFNLEEARKEDADRVETEKTAAENEKEKEAVKALTDEELYQNFKQDLFNKINEKTRTKIQYTKDLDEETFNTISELNLGGVEIKDGWLNFYPGQISDKTYTASVLSRYLNVLPDNLEKTLEGENRYVIIAKELLPEKADKVRDLIKQDESNTFSGLGLDEEYHRLYPENNLDANILGYVTYAESNTGMKEMIGKAGLESSFNTELQGKNGLFEGERDNSIYKRQIAIGDSIIEPAIDGDDVYLTIDRSIQLEVQKRLAEAVKRFDAYSGQVIIMDPRDGHIMAMAQYPDFNPNNLGEALEKEKIDLKPEEIAALVPVKDMENTFWFYRDRDADNRFQVFRRELADGTFIYERYKNYIGFQALQNPMVSLPYEPGSVFKAITMAGALEDKDITPNFTRYNPAVLQLDWNAVTKRYDAEINNAAEKKCEGMMSMTEILAYSCNTGTSWVAMKMGRSLFYSYIMKFGFGERTGIEFEDESAGRVTHFSEWKADSDFATKAYGQGLSVTPIQMITAYAAIANNGVLMQPHIIDKIVKKDGQVIQTDPVPIQRVISEDTAQKVKGMLVAAVERGVAIKTKLDKHYLAAKTGTSQIFANGKYRGGNGNTIASMAGFGPIENPKFVILVKLDRPYQNQWADSTAVYLFRDLSSYLYDYLAIPPDK